MYGGVCGGVWCICTYIVRACKCLFHVPHICLGTVTELAYKYPSTLCEALQTVTSFKDSPDAFGYCLCVFAVVCRLQTTCSSGGGLGGTGGLTLMCRLSVRSRVCSGKDFSQPDWDFAERLGRALIERYRNRRLKRLNAGNNRQEKTL